MKVYVSVPLTDMDFESQIAYMNRAKEHFTQKGFKVVTPFDVVKPERTPYNEARGACVTALLGCDAICLCEGRKWTTAKECKMERNIAKIYGLKIYTI